MRIVFISTPPVASWGGSEELWAATAHEALRAGHDVVVSPRHDRFHEPIELDKLQRRGAKVVHHRPSAMPVGTANDRPWTRDHLRRLELDAASVVLISTGGSYAELLARHLRLALEELAAPYVITRRLTTDADLLSDEDRVAIAGIFARAHRVVFPCRRSLELAERHLAMSLVNGSVLHSPTKVAAPDVLAWPSMRTAYLASVARLAPAQKGQDLLFEAFRSSAWMHRHWRLRLYGSGMARGYLESLADHYGLSHRIEFRGFVPDVHSIWADNHLLILPSRDESLPIALLDAMLCGRPCLVTDVGGHGEWVEDEVTGFVASAAHVTALGVALDRAWAGRSRWQRMGQRAYERAVARYDPTPEVSMLLLLVDAARAGTRGAD